MPVESSGTKDGAIPGTREGASPNAFPGRERGGLTEQAVTPQPNHRPPACARLPCEGPEAGRFCRHEASARGAQRPGACVHLAGDRARATHGASVPSVPRPRRAGSAVLARALRSQARRRLVGTRTEAAVTDLRAQGRGQGARRRWCSEDALTRRRRPAR